MKNWNIPSVEELEVKLTASSGSAGITEACAVYPYDDPANQATYDSTMYEKMDDDDTCVIKIENSASNES